MSRREAGRQAQAGLCLFPGQRQERPQVSSGQGHRQTQQVVKLGRAHHEGWPVLDTSVGLLPFSVDLHPVLLPGSNRPIQVNKVYLYATL